MVVNYVAFVIGMEEGRLRKVVVCQDEFSKKGGRFSGGGELFLFVIYSNPMISKNACETL